METIVLENFFLNSIMDFIDFLILEIFTSSFYPYKQKHQYTYIRAIFLCLYIILPQPVDDILMIAPFIYFLVISSFHFKKSLVFFFKFKTFFYASYFTCALTSALISTRFGKHINYTENYLFFQIIINTTFVFIVLNLFIYHKKLKQLNNKLSFSVHFIIFSFLSIILLLYCNYFLLQNQELCTTTFSYIFLFVVGVTIFNTFNYRTLIQMTDEQIQQKVLIEKYSMELDYIHDVNESLKTLSKIRHDFKNHLIILDGYASKNEIEKQREYIRNLNETIGATKLFDTPSNLLSAVLNTKNTICEKHNITLCVHHSFPYINIDDFSMITILGNILDNAITAAAKTKAGYIELSLIQLDSYLQITCKNNHCEIIQKKNGSLLTTKKHASANHGLGLGNVKACVNKLHGNLNLQYDNDSFCIDIFIPNYPNKR